MCWIGDWQVQIESFQPTFEGEARILLLVDEFSSGKSCLEGRIKLAKLDFFLRYPKYLRRALVLRGISDEETAVVTCSEDIDTKMVRYRFGPWDPSYYAILGRLIGKGLVNPVPYKRGIGYKVSDKGHGIAKLLRQEPSWADMSSKLSLLKRKLNLAGTTLKNFIYENFPEITKASWGDVI